MLIYKTSYLLTRRKGQTKISVRPQLFEGWITQGQGSRGKAGGALAIYQVDSVIHPSNNQDKILKNNVLTERPVN